MVNLGEGRDGPRFYRNVETVLTMRIIRTVMDEHRKIVNEIKIARQRSNHCKESHLVGCRMPNIALASTSPSARLSGS
jgi:hypothetical protein